MHFEVDSLSFLGLTLCLIVSFHDLVGTLLLVCQLDLTQCLQDLLQHAQNYLPENNLKEYHTHLNMPRQGHQKAEGQLPSNFDLR